MDTIYFAYGSNMNFEQLKKRGVRFEFLGTAVLPNYELKFNKKAHGMIGIGYANVVKKLDESVEGLLFAIDDIKKLDVYEGYPFDYQRYELDVVSDGKIIKAFVYTANIEKINDNLKPEGAYLDRLLTAEKYLSEQYFEKLKNTETID